MTMFGLDTNIVIRLPTNDYPQQRLLALDFAEGIGRDYTAFVSLPTVVELDGTLRLASSENADLVDALIASRALEAGCKSIKTFDKKAASRVPGMELLS